ncbi:MAG: DUF4250 domain-containing protein [Muribaculaceae bacterium]|nr:DUF4250 domain-containing protein [Muribaculaceae bacterium]MDE6770035.1 DUF4250 domain-containing protein [Muribaculaceae bacterium]
MNTPSDPVMLMSMLNMKLRDSDYESLGDLCSSLGLDEKEIVAKLSAAGFDYMPEIKQFR